MKRPSLNEEFLFANDEEDLAAEIRYLRKRLQLAEDTLNIAVRHAGYWGDTRPPRREQVELAMDEYLEWIGESEIFPQEDR